MRSLALELTCERAGIERAVIPASLAFRFKGLEAATNGLDETTDGWREAVLFGL